MRKEAKYANMSISLDVECPECYRVFDLFRDQSLTDEGFLFKLICAENGNYGNWGCKNFQKQLDDSGIIIKCPDCDQEISIESVYW